MMNWSDMRENWSRTVATAKYLFPEVSETELKRMDSDPEGVIQHLAERHELTFAEAREVVETWLFPTSQQSYAYAAQ